MEFSEWVKTKDGELAFDDSLMQRQKVFVLRQMAFGKAAFEAGMKQHHNKKLQIDACAENGNCEECLRGDCLLDDEKS
jgi:hypothetical protein